MLPGEGTYTYLNNIYSQYNGTVKITKDSSRGAVSQLDTISVEPSVKLNQVEINEILGSKESSSTPQSSQIVYGRVTKIEDKFCKLDIIAIGD